MIGRATALAAAIALSALAAPAAAESQRLADAWEAARTETDPPLSDAAAAQINITGYHGAVARLCEGFELDVDEIAAASDALVLEGADGLDPEALMRHQAGILVAIGVAHGLFLAEGSLNRETFCAQAAESRDTPGYDHHWR